MPFAAMLSTASQAAQAIDEVCSRCQEQLPGQPDLALVFFSVHHAEAAETFAASVRRRLTPRCLIGCIGEAVIGNDQEIEQRPAVSLWAGRWPRPVGLTPFHLTVEPTGMGQSLLGWPDALLQADPQQSVMLLLGDPYTFPANDFLGQMNDHHRGLRVLGGMASGFRGPGRCRLLLDDRVLDEGAVGVLLEGPVGLRSIVSQGCRPIGQHLVVTRARDNLVEELGGRPVLEQLQALWETLNPRDQELFQQGLHVGVVINEYQGEFQRGDFLVRNVMGVERETGALAITDRVRVGQTVQFHVRDAATADEDLRALLQRGVQGGAGKLAGGLVFSCNGRGSRLFNEPNHDAQAIRAAAGPIPLAGFFAQGELGPVGGQNFIHGFTASVALFEEQPGD
jgi:small ligand-binding sensory domain FIST